MDKPIRTYNDMCEERERLKNLLVVQKQRVSQDWNEIKDSLSPVKNVMGIVNKMTKGDKSNAVVNTGLKVASDLFLKNFLLAKAGWVTRLAVPFLVKNYSSHVLAEKGKAFFSRVAAFLEKRKNVSSVSKAAVSDTVVDNATAGKMAM